MSSWGWPRSDLAVWLRSRSSRAFVYSGSSITSLLIATHGHLSGTLPIVTAAAFCNSLAIYTFNDLTDVSVGEINANDRSRAVVGLGKRKAALTVALFSALGLALSLSLNYLCVLVTLLGDLVGFAYSLPYLRIKDRFLVKTLTIGVGGMLSSLFGGLAATGVASRGTFLPALLFFVFVFVTSPINDLADYAGDKANGRRTIPIVVGQRATVILALLVSVTPAMVTLLTFRAFGYNVLAFPLMAALAGTSVLLLRPLLARYDDARYVRRRHKKMVFLHFFLQGSLVVAAL